MPRKRRKSAAPATKISPPADSANPTPPEPTSLETQPLLHLSECTNRPIRWLWHNRIPLGKPTLLVGDPDAGKSFVALDLAAAVSKGMGIPPEPGLEQPGQVLLLCADDDVEDTILPRLEAADADLSRIAILAGDSIRKKDEAPRLFSLHTEFNRLTAALDQLPDCRLIVIDPLNAYLRGLGGNNDISIRQILQRLARLARDQNAAVLLISHQRKQAGPTSLYRPLGSMAYAAVARVVLFLANDPHVAGRKLLLPAKMILHAAPTARAFSIEDGRVIWEEEVIKLSADDLHVINADAKDHCDPLAEAREWLINQLEKKDRLPAEEVKRRAAERRIPWRILWAAKKAAKVTNVYDGKQQVWYWKLPDNWLRDYCRDLTPVYI